MWQSWQKLYVAKNCRYLSEVWICSKTHNVYCPFEFSGNSRNTVAHYFYARENFLKKAYYTIMVYFTSFSFWFKYLAGYNNQNNKKVRNQRALCEKDFKYLNS